MEAAHGQEALIAAIERAVEFGRSKPTTCAPPRRRHWRGPTTPAGDALIVDLPAVAVRSLGDYAMGTE